MDVFIYLREPTGHGLDELEDALTDALGDEGEVTGSGTGASGANLDVQFFEEIGETRAFAHLARGARQLLASCLIGSDSSTVDVTAFSRMWSRFETQCF